MEEYRRCLERQERERKERNRRADEINELQGQVDEQVLIAVAMEEEENQGRRRGSQVGRRWNVDRHRHSRGKNLLEDYFIPTALYSDVDFRRRFRMQPHLFNKVMHDICNYDAYFVQKCDAAGVLGLLPEQKITVVIRMLAYGASVDQVDEVARMGKSTTLEALVRFCDAVENLYTRDYLRRPTPRDLQRLLQKGEARGFPGMIGSIDCMHWQWKNCPTALQVYQTGYYLADGIYPRWTTFFKSIPNPQSQKQKLFATYQEGYRKDVERCFGILQARWLIVRGAARMFDEEILRSIMMTCIILHNMIVEDEYDYDAGDVYEPDPMNTALTRVYEMPMGPNGEPFEPEPLERDDHIMTRMIDRYTEMQSSYIHERRQLDLMEHLWAGTYGLYPSPWFPDPSSPYLFCANTPFLVHTRLELPPPYLGVSAPFQFLWRFALQFPPKTLNYDCLDYPLSLPSQPFGQ
ncbi:unnamed protein product [Prunus brigantina]